MTEIEMVEERRGYWHRPGACLAQSRRTSRRRQHPGCGPRTDRVGRRWLDTLQCIIYLRSVGVKIGSLDETESWTQYLELGPDDPMAFVGHQMVSTAAWVANQGREVGRRRTREGLAVAKARGKSLGTPAFPQG